MAYQEKIKKTLSEIRKSVGLTQTALAKKMGTTQEYVCRMEKSGAVTMEKFSQYVAACGGVAKLVARMDDDKVFVVRLTEKKHEGKA